MKELEVNNCKLFMWLLPKYVGLFFLVDLSLVNDTLHGFLHWVSNA